MSYGKVYMITNLINGKVYVGQTTKADVMLRFNEHCTEKRNRHVSKAIQKYGKENFKVEIVSEAHSQEELNQLESNFVVKFDSMFPNGYNHRAGGNQNGICSEELRRKISEAKLGKPNLKRRGENRSQEQRSQISRSLGGQQIKATNLSTGEVIILNTAHDGKQYGFNPSNIVSICKKHGRRFQTKGYTFEYISQANQSGSVDSNESSHAQRLEIETANAE